VVGQSSNRLASISLMKFYDSSVQAAYNSNFNLPPPPNSPTVTATSRDGTIYLSWVQNAETYSQPPYAFEGYNVYQGSSVAGPWTRLATYDAVNGITVVLDEDFNEEQGLILPTGKAFGTDIGLRYQIELSEDKIRGGPLYNAQTYYYTVTAYAVGLGETPQVLESAYNPLTVVPQGPAAGVDLASAQVSDITQAQIVTGPTPSTDVVTATAVDPAEVIDASWKVGFKPNGAGVVWYLTRTVGAATDTVINNWTDFSYDEAFPVIDGVQVKLLSYPLGELANVAYVDTAGGSPAAFAGAAGRGLRFFDGAADYGAYYPGSSMAALGHYNNCMIRFGPPYQLAYHFVRVDPGDTLHGFVQVPFTAWDLDLNQQINVAFREEEGTTAPFDSAWAPSTSSNGGREPFWLMGSAYTGTADPSYYVDPMRDMLSGEVDLRYEVYPRLTSAGATADPGDKIMFFTSVPSTPNDFFTFTTTTANQMNVAMGKSQLDLIKAVPNPYFAHSSYELTQFERVVKFTHLPAQCKIRLFNLAGDLVRTIDKNDNTSQATWNLQTENGLPIGSGIYVYHIDAGSLGTKIGKVAIFVEKERLNNY
jgi:hypothetical protein